MLAVRLYALFFALITAGCSAQSSPSKLDPETQRRIEIQLRNRLPIPQSVRVEVGDRRPSDIGGWDALTVNLVSERGRQPLELLISKDGKQLAHMERFKLDELPGSKVNLEGRPVRGNPDAKVSVVVFDDFACQYCAAMHKKLFTTLLTEYGDRVRFIYKDYPLEQIHPWAVRAAVNANCLGEQNPLAYWDYADYVHANQQKINRNEKGERRQLPDSFTQLDESARGSARKLGLDVNRVNACIAKQNETAVRASMKEGSELGIDGTPHLFINGRRIGGDTDIDNLRAILDESLIAAGQQPPQRPASAVNK